MNPLWLSNAILQSPNRTPMDTCSNLKLHGPPHGNPMHSYEMLLESNEIVIAIVIGSLWESYGIMLRSLGIQMKSIWIALIHIMCILLESDGHPMEFLSGFYAFLGSPYGITLTPALA